MKNKLKKEEKKNKRLALTKEELHNQNKTKKDEANGQSSDINKTCVPKLTPDISSNESGQENKARSFAPMTKGFKLQ